MHVKTLKNVLFILPGIGQFPGRILIQLITKLILQPTYSLEDHTSLNYTFFIFLLNNVFNKPKPYHPTFKNNLPTTLRILHLYPILPTNDVVIFQ